jgi:putative transport protein
MDAVSRYFGDSIRGTAETDFGSVAIGMVLGALVGMIPIPMRGTVVRLGLAGGPLLVALVLGKLERTGRITWKMPISANLTLRQIGLLLFFAAVGTRAGYPFGQTLMTNGWQFIAAGTLITFAVAFTTLIFGYKVLGMPFDAVMGITSGIHTEPASLTYAANLTRNDRPNTGYTTVYPIAMIAKIILAQLLV